MAQDTRPAEKVAPWTDWLIICPRGKRVRPLSRAWVLSSVSAISRIRMLGFPVGDWAGARGRVGEQQPASLRRESRGCGCCMRHCWTCRNVSCPERIHQGRQGGWCSGSRADSMIALPASLLCEPGQPPFPLCASGFACTVENVNRDFLIGFHED